MIDKIKLKIVYIFSCTGIVLLSSAIFEMINGNKLITSGFILEIFGANVLTFISGYIISRIINRRYAFLRFLLDFCFTLFIILTFWKVFSWDTSVWVPVIIVSVVYILFYLLNIGMVSREIMEINELLQKLKEKNDDNAS